MANKFSRIQTTKSRYLEAENALAPLTMITGPEALALAKAGQELIGTNEELIYKYRDEFLHIQRAAENGLTTLNMLVEDPAEFGILATAWGFVATVRSRFDTKILYTKNLAETETTTELSNINIDWAKPGKVTIDVDYYRMSGNAVLLEESTITIPIFSKVDIVKRQLGLSPYERYFFINYFGNNFGALAAGNGASIPIGIGLGLPYTLPFFATTKGRGYKVGETIIVYGKDLGGTTPDNNATFVIKEVDAFGGITNISVKGVAGTSSGANQTNITLVSSDTATLQEFYS